MFVSAQGKPKYANTIMRMDFRYATVYVFSLKDCELNELRKNIELLKKQNNVAQAAINGVINTPELTCKQNRTGMENRTKTIAISPTTSNSSLEVQ